MLKSVPMIPSVTKRKLMPEHWTFPPMETRAIMAFNTGNLVFRGTKAFKFKGKMGGTNTCLFPMCNATDTLYHVMWNCEWYRQEGIIPKDTWREDGKSVSRDLADYLLELNEFRIKRWQVPLIVIDGWL